jgi:uncharacterized membrane protein YqjE
MKHKIKLVISFLKENLLRFNIFKNITYKIANLGLISFVGLEIFTINTTNVFTTHRSVKH